MKNVNLEQLIKDPVNALIKQHLEFSNSVNGMPSNDRGGLRGRFIASCIEERYTEEEWDALKEEEKAGCFYRWGHKFDEAAKEADRKWEAVKVILDI